MATFGNTNVQSGRAQIDYGSETDTGEYIFGAQFTAPGNGTVTSITVFLDFVPGARQVPRYYAKCAIYTRDAVAKRTISSA